MRTDSHVEPSRGAGCGSQKVMRLPSMHRLLGALSLSWLAAAPSSCSRSHRYGVAAVTRLVASAVATRNARRLGC